jgi:hypothetical protein
MFNEIKTWSGIGTRNLRIRDPDQASKVSGPKTLSSTVISILTLSNSVRVPRKLQVFSPTVQSHILVPNQVPIKMIAPPHIWLIIPENIRVRYFYRNTILLSTFSFLFSTFLYPIFRFPFLLFRLPLLSVDCTVPVMINSTCLHKNNNRLNNKTINTGNFPWYSVRYRNNQIIKKYLLTDYQCITW